MICTGCISLRLGAGGRVATRFALPLVLRSVEIHPDFPQ